jgi:hypothetical protein
LQHSLRFCALQQCVHFSDPEAECQARFVHCTIIFSISQNRLYRLGLGTNRLFFSSTTAIPKSVMRQRNKQASQVELQ